MRKKYIVSGLPPGYGGVGRLVAQLQKKAEQNGFRFIARKQTVSLKLLLSKKSYILLLGELISRLVDCIVFYFKVKSIPDTEVVLIHPQSIGLKNCLDVFKRKKNRVYLYVMDASFFCIRSYNYLNKKECLRCVQNVMSQMVQCEPFPRRYNKKKNIEYLRLLKNFSQEIGFLAQNHSQMLLLKEHFGSLIKVDVIGMDTGELVREKQVKLPNSKDSYNFVYHGADLKEKGIEYYICLAEIMNGYTFFIPYEQAVCEALIERPINATNITFNACTWETGLRDAVENSDVIVNPSLWSAPIEGALLKSIWYGKRVAVVETEFGFEKDIFQKYSLIRLPVDHILAVNVLNDALSTPPIAKELKVNIRNEILPNRFYEYFAEK